MREYTYDLKTVQRLGQWLTVTHDGTNAPNFGLHLVNSCCAASGEWRV